ncbi:unnamed protein product [Symbiodinium natans]|uniref:Uncharacterized protein n=1 Tax=Symbiodinium natans TaxID=878477 RepID=A0A812HAI5_9DINO|nr:unnamed protein product [Symbiodinium natans]
MPRQQIVLICGYCGIVSIADWSSKGQSLDVSDRNWPTHEDSGDAPSTPARGSSLNLQSLQVSETSTKPGTRPCGADPTDGRPRPDPLGNALDASASDWTTSGVYDAACAQSTKEKGEATVPFAPTLAASARVTSCEASLGLATCREPVCNASWPCAYYAAVATPKPNWAPPITSSSEYDRNREGLAAQQKAKKQMFSVSAQDINTGGSVQNTFEADRFRSTEAASNSQCRSAVTASAQSCRPGTSFQWYAPDWYPALSNRDVAEFGVGKETNNAREPDLHRVLRESPEEYPISEILDIFGAASQLTGACQLKG